MPIGIIDRFEPVYVQKDERGLTASAAHAGALTLYGQFEGSTVHDAGQRVCGGEGEKFCLLTGYVVLAHIMHDTGRNRETGREGRHHRDENGPVLVKVHRDQQGGEKRG